MVIQEEVASFNVVLKGLCSGCCYVSQEVFCFVPSEQKKVQFCFMLLRDMSLMSLLVFLLKLQRVEQLWFALCLGFFLDTVFFK